MHHCPYNMKLSNFGRQTAYSCVQVHLTPSTSRATDSVRHSLMILSSTQATISNNYSAIHHHHTDQLLLPAILVPFCVTIGSEISCR